MTTAFEHLLNIGLLQQLWTFSEPYFFAIQYSIIAAGFAIQYMVLRKISHKAGRWAFAGILALAIAGCEVGFHLAGGWDRLGVLIIYCGVICLVLGCIPATVVYYFKKNAG